MAMGPACPAHGNEAANCPMLECLPRSPRTSELMKPRIWAAWSPDQTGAVGTEESTQGPAQG